MGKLDCIQNVATNFIHFNFHTKLSLCYDTALLLYHVISITRGALTSCMIYATISPD
jgi:hypothetical protein